MTVIIVLAKPYIMYEEKNMFFANAAKQNASNGTRK
jgi:hypothetical protein